MRGVYIVLKCRQNYEQLNFVPPRQDTVIMSAHAPLKVNIANPILQVTNQANAIVGMGEPDQLDLILRALR